MAMRSFYNQIKTKKLSEVPAHIKPMLNRKYISEAWDKGRDRYIEKYIETNSIDPLLHVCYGGMAFSFIISIPEELRRHKEHEQKHGAH